MAVGGSTETPVDVRIIATTNRDMREEVKASRFREDLFYRLNVFPINTLALRDRIKDIIPIAANMVFKLDQQSNVHTLLTGEAIDALIQYDWPGNVRELENAVERSVILADKGKKIEADLLGIADVRTRVEAKSKVSSNSKKTDEESMEQVERKHIQKVLESCEGNRTHAAKKLGLNVRTLRNKIKEYGLDN